MKNRLLNPVIHDSKLRIEYIMAAFIFLLIVSTAFSVDIYTSVVGTWTRQEGLLTWFGYLSMFYLYYRLINYNETTLVDMLKKLFIVSAIISVYGFMQHFDVDFLSLIVSWDSPTSSIAFFDNPNFYGTYLVITMGIGMGLFLMAATRNHLWFYGIILFFMTSVLLYTNTRSAWIGMAVVALYYTLTLVRENKLWKQWIPLLIAMGIMAIVINASEEGRYLGKIFKTIDETEDILEDGLTGHEGSSRLIIWKKDLTILDDYFWIGSGVDTHGIVFPATPDELEEYFSNRTIMVDKAHNEYLQLAVTVGVPALVCYLILVFMVVRKAIKALQIAEDREKYLLHIMLAVISGYLVQANFNISVVSVAPIYWALLGTVYGYSSYILSELAIKKINY